MPFAGRGSYGIAMRETKHTVSDRPTGTCSSALKHYWRLAVAIVACGVALVCYYPNLNNFFVAEDLLQVWSTQPANLLHQLFPNQVAGYRPLMFVWWWACYNLFGYHPVAFRWLILMLHAVNGALLYAVTLALSRRKLAGLMAAVLYLPMPIHSDTLNWLSAASNEVTCGFFYFLCILLYLRYRSNRNVTGQGPRRFRDGAILSMLGALGTNEIALTLPFILLSLDVLTPPSSTPDTLPGWQGLLKAGARRSAPFFAAWLLFVAVRTLAVHGIGGYGAEVHLRAGDYLFQTGQDLVRMVLLPFSADSALSPAISSIFASHVTLLCTLCVACAALWGGRAGLCIFVMAALPVLNIPAYHRLYMPAAGLAIAVAMSLTAVPRPLRRPWAVLAAAASVILVVGVFIRQYNALIERNREWAKASTITAFVPTRTRELVPAVPPETAFYYYGLPQNLGNGVQVFSWGLQQVIQAAYNDRSLRAYRVQMDATHIANLDRNPSDILQQSITETNQLFFVFDAQRLTLEKLPRDGFLRIVEGSVTGP